MAFGIGDELSVKVSADTADFTAGVESAQDRTEELAEELAALSRRASRAADSMEEAGDEATQATGSFTGLAAAAGSSGVAFAFQALATRAGRLTFAIIALGTALTPVVAGLAAIAAIGGSIGLVGLTGGLLAATQRTETLKRELRLTAQAFTTAFAPVTEEATRVILGLIRQFRSLIGELVPGEEQIRTIADAFLRIGTNVIDAIPPLAQAATELTTRFLPSIADSSDGVGDFAQKILNLVRSDRFSNFLDNIFASAKELAPEIKQIAENLGGLLDEESLKGITTLVDGFLDLLVVITGILDKLDLLLEGISKVSSTFGGVGGSSLGAAGQSDTGNVGDVIPDTAPPGSQNAYVDANRGQTNVNVTVEGDNDVVRDVSAEVIENRERRARRNTGGNTTP